MRIAQGARYQRNQIEEALAYAVHFRPPVQPELRLEIKRLLDTDRKIGISPRAKSAESRHLAFVSHRPEGTGFNIEYADYDVFALYVGIKLLRAGFTQLGIATLMRRLRPALIEKHQEILSWQPASLLDNKPEVDLETSVSEGQLVKTLENMVCLILPTGKYSGLAFKTQADQDQGRPANIAHGKDAIEDRLQIELAFGATPVTIELVNPTHRLAYWLRRTERLERGRK
ncbi:MAG: hypothetical protein RO009_01630 [Pseudorhodoplanes sp.]|jgi:hypothetical protein|nr:hypothetical protein [Pseudorhodoplanes sp.]